MSCQPVNVHPTREPEAVSEPLLSGYPDVLTVQHITSITGLSEPTIRREMRAGNIPCARIGRRWFCPKHKFVEYLEGGKTW